MFIPSCKLSKLAFAKLLYCLRPNLKYIFLLVNHYQMPTPQQIKTKHRKYVAQNDKQIKKKMSLS